MYRTVFRGWKHCNLKALALGLLIVCGWTNNASAQVKFTIDHPLVDLLDEMSIYKLSNSRLITFKDYYVLIKEDKLHFHPKNEDGAPVVFEWDPGNNKITSLYCDAPRDLMKRRDLLRFLTKDQVEMVKKSIQLEDLEIDKQISAMLRDETLHFDLESLKSKRLNSFKMSKMLRADENAFFKNKGGNGVCFAYRFSNGDPNEPVSEHAILILQEKSQLGVVRYTHMAMFTSGKVSRNKYISSRKNGYYVEQGSQDKEANLNKIQDLLFKSNTPEILIVGSEDSEVVAEILKAILIAGNRGFTPKSIRLNLNNAEVALGVVLGSGNIVRIDDVAPTVRLRLLHSLLN